MYEYECLCMTMCVLGLCRALSRWQPTGTAPGVCACRAAGVATGRAANNCTISQQSQHFHSSVSRDNYWVRNEKTSDLDMGRRPELKSEVFFMRTQ